MKAHPDCVPCVLAQVLRASRRVTDDEAQLLAVLARAMELLHDRLDSGTPADLSTMALRAVSDYFGVTDFYADERRHTNQIMLALEPELRKLIEYSSDPLRTALKIAAAANMIDFGITDDIDVTASLEKAMTLTFAVDHTDQLIADLARSKKLLYLADNSGEIVADKLALETIGHANAWVAVRGAPMLNDATIEDASEVGLGSAAKVISNGSDRLGTVLEDCSPQLRRCFNEAGVIISKGQANYESLEHVEANIYFILTAKCDLVANQLGVKLGDVVVARRDGGVARVRPQQPLPRGAMTMARVSTNLLIAAAIVVAAHMAGADPSGYLAPEGDRNTVEKAARVFRDGVRLLEKGSAGPALGKFRRAATLCPDFFEARYNVAKLEGEKGGRERAVAELEALARDFPSNVRAFNDLGHLLVETDVEAAGRAFDTAAANGEKLLKGKAIIDAGPGTVAQIKVDLAFAYHNRGAWRLSAGELDGAVADLQRSVELNGANFFSHYGLGLAHLQRGDYAAAKASFKRAKALKSPFADCSIGLARAYLGETPPQPAAAIAELNEAGKVTGATAQSETLYGDAYRLLGKLEAAIDRYGKALELGADAATILLKLAVVARDQKDFETARERLRECIEQTTDNPLLARAYQHLGELAEIDEDFEAAAKRFAAAAELDPEAHGARLHLGVCLYRMGRLDEAEEHLAAVIERCGDEPPPALAADLALARKVLDKIRASGENDVQPD